MALWTNDDVEFFKKNLENHFAHILVKRSTLGGESRALITMLLCFDKKETWTNGILENSRYVRIMIDYNGKVEQFSGLVEVKMRAFTSEDRNKIVAKIIDFKNKVQPV